MIHQYQNNGYNIVMDVNSGSVHVVEPVVYDAIAVVASQIPELEKPENCPKRLKTRPSPLWKEGIPARRSRRPWRTFRNLLTWSSF